MEAVLGIDVGGTSIKAGLFTPEGELLEERKIPTPALVDDAAYAAVTDGLKRILDAHDATPEDVIACGLDIPGPVADDGTVGFLPNIKLDPEGLVGAISSVFPRAQIAFVNDANAAALGEMWAGVAHGTSSYVLIALGTGVGAGVVVNGRLVAGAFGAGGEIGHITVNPHETLTCGCGRKGCLEQYASAKGIVRLYLAECEARGVTPVKVEHATDTLSVFRALAAGDDCAKPDVRVSGPGHGPGLLRRRPRHVPHRRRRGRRLCHVCPGAASPLCRPRASHLQGRPHRGREPGQPGGHVRLRLRGPAPARRGRQVGDGHFLPPFACVGAPLAA